MTETVLYATGRQGDTDKLALSKAGLKADKRGRIQVDENYRTEVDAHLRRGRLRRRRRARGHRDGAGPDRGA